MDISQTPRVMKVKQINNFSKNSLSTQQEISKKA